METSAMDNPLAMDGVNAGTFETEDGSVDGGRLSRDIVTAEVELEALKTKLSRLEATSGMDASTKLAEYERRMYEKDEELGVLRKMLFVETKSHPSKKKRNKHQKLYEDLASQDSVHESPNSIASLQALQRRSMDMTGAKETKMVWAFVFAMPTDSHIAMSEEEAAILMDEDPNAFPDAEPTGVDPSQDRSMRVSHECWLFCEKCFACDLVLNFVMPIDCRTIIVTIGATYDVLVDEASGLKMLMRLQETKGSHEFHPDLVRFYASNHGGMNEWSGGNWTRRSTDDMDNGTHWMTDDMLDKPQLEERRKREHQIFTSTHMQRLVMSRLRRLGRFNPGHLMKLASKPTPDTRMLGHVTNRSVVKHRIIPASMLNDLLLLFGGYRPQAASVFPLVKGRSVIMDIGKSVIADDQFVLRPDGLQTMKTMVEEEKPTYDKVCDAVHILDRWKQGAGKDEVWFGTLQKYYPLHTESELVFLRQEWGSPKNIFRSTLIGYDPENQPTVFDPGPPKQMAMNTFGSCGNILHEHDFPWSLTYQPLEEIRDYFGDEVGLYFSWLGKYTAMLFLCSVFGVLVMCAQPYFGGVEKNPFTLAYSIYVGLWSISFLEAWARRENELQFLWGTAELKSIEEPRPEFDGVMETNFETGRQVLEHKSVVTYYLKMTVSTAVCVIFILFTIVSAMAAQTVRYIEPTNDDGLLCVDIKAALEREQMDGSLDPAFDGVEPCHLLHRMKFKLGSSMLNLIIIGVYGFIFEGLADQLASWENHRTEAEYDNSRVAKNFLFQFINNYFVLFYIAYMREVVDPITKKAHPCENGNCLPELQTQLLVVFTGKTIGKQIAYTIRPFLFKYKAAFCANRITQQLVKGAAKGKSVLPATMKAALNQVTAITGGRNDPVQQLKELKKVRNTYELQAQLPPYDGTFDDFNDRVIQFGYLVLFAPAFPLAPFFAFINNVVEIRTGGYRMVKAYQRPVAKARSGIGSWLGVLNVLGFLAVITNASMITFVGSLDAEEMGLTTTGFLDRTNEWRLWARFVLTEHCVLFMRVVILSLAPEEPRWINDAWQILECEWHHVLRTCVAYPVMATR
jgi:hypothetical protein